LAVSKKKNSIFRLVDGSKCFSKATLCSQKTLKFDFLLMRFSLLGRRFSCLLVEKRLLNSV
jgi:hypothetical protein